MEKTQETASVDFGDELQKIYKVQPRLSRLHLLYINTTSRTTIAEFWLHGLFPYRQQQDNCRECL